MALSIHEIHLHRRTPGMKLIEAAANGRLQIAVKRGGGLGDVLLTTPVLRALKEKYPGCEITFITGKINEPVVKGSPFIDRLVTCSHFYEILYSPLKGYDYEFNLIYERYPAMHIIDAYAKIAGVLLSDKTPHLVITEAHEREAERFLKYYGITPDTLLIGVHRGPTWLCRTWPVQRYIDFAKHMKKKYGAVFVEFSRQKGFGAGLGIDLTGKTSIRQMAAILRRCNMLLCIDSFVLHLASVSATPTVAVFGCTNPELRLPFNDVSVGLQTKGDCKGCYHRQSRMKTHHSCFRDRVYCMEEVSAEAAIEAAEGLISNHRDRIMGRRG